MYEIDVNDLIFYQTFSEGKLQYCESMKNTVPKFVILNQFLQRFGSQLFLDYACSFGHQTFLIQGFGFNKKIVTILHNH